MGLLDGLVLVVLCRNLFRPALLFDHVIRVLEVQEHRRFARCETCRQPCDSPAVGLMTQYPHDLVSDPIALFIILRPGTLHVCPVLLRANVLDLADVELSRRGRREV